MSNIKIECFMKAAETLNFTEAMVLSAEMQFKAASIRKESRGCSN